MPLEDSQGVNEQLLNKLRRANPNWNLNYTGREGTDPVFDSGGEDYLSWNPGQGAGRDMTSPVLHTPYKAPDMPDLFSPEMLGYTPDEALRFKSGGAEGLPAYMLKQRIYGPGVSLGGDDPVATYLNAMKNPTGGEIGKAGRILGGMGWGAGPEGLKFSGAPGETTDAYSTMVEPPAGEQPQWGDPEQQKFARDYLARKWGVNDGTPFTNPEKAMNMIGSLASIAAPIAGIGALGAFAAPVAGAAAGAEAGASELAPLSASQISAEFPAMAGTSLSGGDLAATPGFFGSGIGVGGSADAALGGMYGTGAGLEGATLSNAPVQSTGKTPEDFLKEKGKGALRNYAVKSAAKALTPTPEMPEESGYGSAESGESAQALPQIESGYYNRFTGERLSPEEFFRMHGRAQSMR